MNPFSWLAFLKSMQYKGRGTLHALSSYKMQSSCQGEDCSICVQTTASDGGVWHCSAAHRTSCRTSVRLEGSSCSEQLLTAALRPLGPYGGPTLRVDIRACVYYSCCLTFHPLLELAEGRRAQARGGSRLWLQSCVTGSPPGPVRCLCACVWYQNRMEPVWWGSELGVLICHAYAFMSSA